MAEGSAGREDEYHAGDQFEGGVGKNDPHDEPRQLFRGEPDPDRYDKGFLHCDVLVIGAGPAGLAAALTAGRSGARVILADEDFRLGGRLTPPAPGDALYIDALATHPDFRRQGVATALLDAAERRARASGLNAIALDTAERNFGAQALYESFGMERSGSSQGVGQIPGAIAYVKRL